MTGLQKYYENLKKHRKWVDWLYFDITAERKKSKALVWKKKTTISNDVDMSRTDIRISLQYKFAISKVIQEKASIFNHL